MPSDPLDPFDFAGSVSAKALAGIRLAAIYRTRTHQRDAVKSELRFVRGA